MTDGKTAAKKFGGKFRRGSFEEWEIVRRRRETADGENFGERGYQGAIGATTGTINMPATQEYYMGWSEMTTSTNILQPSKDWLYSVDSVRKALAFASSYVGAMQKYSTTPPVNVVRADSSR